MPLSDGGLVGRATIEDSEGEHGPGDGIEIGVGCGGREISRSSVIGCASRDTTSFWSLCSREVALPRARESEPNQDVDFGGEGSFDDEVDFEVSEVGIAIGEATVLAGRST